MTLNIPNGAYRTNNSVPIDLQLNLLNSWTKFKVADYYQNIFLEYVDDLEPAKAEQIIKKEVMLTLENKSPYFQLEKYQEQRKNILKRLHNNVDNKEQIHSVTELSLLCQDLKELREANLKVGEYILKMHHSYICKKMIGAEKQLEYFDQLFDKLDRDNEFLKKSALSNYIVFDQGYDPFLMSAYEHVHRTQMRNLSQPIKDFYTLNISYAYKLMKTKNSILQLRSKAHIGASQDINKNQLSYYRNFDENPTEHSKKLRPKPLKNLSLETDNSRITIKEPPKKIKPIQIFPSAVGKMNSLSGYAESSERKSKYRTEPNEPIKLKFQRVGDDVSRVSSFRFEPIIDSSSQYQQKESERSKVGMGAIRRNSQKHENINNDGYLRSLKKESVPQKNHESQQKLRLGVGKLTPIRPKRYSTQANLNESYIDKTQPINHTDKAREYLNVQPIVHQSRIKLPLLQQQKGSNNKNWSAIDLADQADPKVKKIQNYNPIKKDEYSIKDTNLKDRKYDFNPSARKQRYNTQGNDNFQPKQLENDNDGLLYESPLGKYSGKYQKKTNRIDYNRNNSSLPVSQILRKKSSGRRKLVDQDCQTVEVKKSQNQTQSQRAQEKQPQEMHNQSTGSYNRMPIGSQSVQQPQQEKSRQVQNQSRGQPYQQKQQEQPFKYQRQQEEQRIREEPLPITHKQSIQSMNQQIIESGYPQHQSFTRKQSQQNYQQPKQVYKEPKINVYPQQYNQQQKTQRETQQQEVPQNYKQQSNQNRQSTSAVQEPSVQGQYLQPSQSVKVSQQPSSYVSRSNNRKSEVRISSPLISSGGSIHRQDIPPRESQIYKESKKMEPKQGSKPEPYREESQEPVQTIPSHQQQVYQKSNRSYEQPQLSQSHNSQPFNQQIQQTYQQPYQSSHRQSSVATSNHQSVQPPKNQAKVYSQPGEPRQNLSNRPPLSKASTARGQNSQQQYVAAPSSPSSSQKEEKNNPVQQNIQYEHEQIQYGHPQAKDGRYQESISKTQQQPNIQKQETVNKSYQPIVGSNKSFADINQQSVSQSESKPSTSKKDKSIKNSKNSSKSESKVKGQKVSQPVRSSGKQSMSKNIQQTASPSFVPQTINNTVPSNASPSPVHQTAQQPAPITSAVNQISSSQPNNSSQPPIKTSNNSEALKSPLQVSPVQATQEKEEEKSESQQQGQSEEEAESEEKSQENKEESEQNEQSSGSQEQSSSEQQQKQEEKNSEDVQKQEEESEHQKNNQISKPLQNNQIQGHKETSKPEQLKQQIGQQIQQKRVASERPLPSAKARNFELKMKQVPTSQSRMGQNSQKSSSQIGESKDPNAVTPPGDKKQVRMKICKQKASQIISLLQKINVSSNYKASLDRKKMIDWVSNNQTYCIYFYLNQQLAILTLCSPVPDIGMIVKLWAPVEGQVTDKITTTLFKKYVELIQKSTTVQKILYSGPQMPELKEAQFEKINETFFERTRKLQMVDEDNEFKLFLYIECSNVKFDNLGDLTLLYSTQIESFTQQNSYAVDFMGQAKSQIPKKLQQFVKFTPKLQNFAKVNQILTQQDFDNYEASQMFIKNIDLIRFYLNCPLKSAFVAHQGYLKLTGNLLYQQDDKYLISLGVVKNHGLMYFGKGLQLKQIIELSKNKTKKIVKFSVVMFNKKLYGAMSNYPHGCYGCWEINLVWEDECPGKIIHEMKQAYSFTDEGFSVMIELSGLKLFGFKVGREDSIL